MRTFRQKAIMAIVGAFIVGSVMFASAGAISLFSEVVAGIGNTQFTDEVEVVKIKVKSLSTVLVRMNTSVDTVADRVYTVELYGDDILLDTDTVSWAAVEFGTEKDVIFIDLSLGSITELDVDVVY